MNIRTPQTVIDAQLDAIQKNTEKQFQEAFMQVNRRKARLFYEAGYRQALKDHGIENQPITTPSNLALPSVASIKS